VKFRTGTLPNLGKSPKCTLETSVISEDTEMQHATWMSQFIPDGVYHRIEKYIYVSRNFG